MNNGAYLRFSGIDDIYYKLIHSDMNYQNIDLNEQKKAVEIIVALNMNFTTINDFLIQQNHYNNLVCAHFEVLFFFIC